MSQSIAVLPERAALFVGGAQAEDFLHNLLTCEVKGLKAGEGRYGALLSPQGKILFDMFLTRTDDGFLLDVSTAALDDLVRRLAMYRLRSKVEIERRPDLSVAAIWGEGELATGGAIYADPRYAGLGYRTMAADVAANAAADAYHAHRIGLGVADWDSDMGSGELFPHEANLDQLGGVSFGKGCYVGQEVVSRMQHRGTGARSRILPVRFDHDAPPRGTEVLAGDRKVGAILSGSGSRALALLRLDKVAAAYAAGEELRAEGQALAIERPAWATFDIPRRGAAA